MAQPRLLFQEGDSDADISGLCMLGYWDFVMGVSMRLKLLAVLLLSASTVSLAQSGSKPLATINGQPITQAEVDQAASVDLENAEVRKAQAEADYDRAKYAAVEKALDGLVTDKLLDAEATKRGVSKIEIVADEVDRKAVPPTDAEIVSFYETNKSRINGELENLKPQIHDYLLDQKKDELFSGLIARLRKEHKVESFLEPRRVPVQTAGFPTLGPVDAPVTIVEFSDFECPFCGNLYPTMKLVESNYAGKIRIVFRQFPLNNIHPHAQKAAEASLCANDQNRFWEYHDAMFQDQRNLTIDALKQKAAKLNLNQEVFAMCLDSGKHVDTVKKDVSEGVRLGISGTPSTFINGRFLDGARPYADIMKIVEEELVSAKK
jgi:predicted DsbA family dithiol-disulfide isomerase/Skp family chaperone for outer membrane proteins